MRIVWVAPSSMGALLALSILAAPRQTAAPASEIGATDVAATPRSRGTIFVSPSGKGTGRTAEDPCGFDSLDLYKGRLKVKPGDVVFFRGGIYKFSLEGARRVYLKGGTATAPVVYESYPGERAIFDGSFVSTEDTRAEPWREGRLQLRGEYAILRRVEVRNMPQYGIRIFGNHNIVEGCRVHDNHLSGIEIANFRDGFSTKDTGGSHNIVRNNWVYGNSDVGLTHGNFGDGDNADGITIHSGVDNLISHNTVFANSDDGIDTWKSMKTIVEHNLVFGHGKDPRGNGNGIKLGGAGKDSPLGAGAVARHNLVYSNKRHGINTNSGKNVRIERNTAFNNGGFGYTAMNDTILEGNLSFRNKSGHVGWSRGKRQTDNSWQKPGSVRFLSTDPTSPDFLKPVAGGGFDAVGAYAPEIAPNP